MGKLLTFPDKLSENEAYLKRVGISREEMLVYFLKREAFLANFREEEKEEGDLLPFSHPEDKQ